MKHPGWIGALLALAGGLALSAVASISAATPPQLSLEAPDLHTVQLAWTGEPGPTGVFLIDRSITATEAAPRQWQSIADTKLRSYEDTNLQTGGWYCYRVRAKADDFAWSNEACLGLPGVDGPAGSPTDGIPVPAAGRWETTIQPPDIVGVSRIFAWDWPVDGGVDAIIEASVEPRLFSDVVPPFVTYARIAASEPPKVSVTTLPWRGTYRFRVRFTRDGQVGEPSPVAIIPRSADIAPYDILNFSVVQRPLSRTAKLTWEYRFRPTTVTIQRANLALPAEEDWQTIATDVPARSDGDIGEFVDPHTMPGTACYRARANIGGPLEFGEDSIWSPQQCTTWAQGPIDGPLAPDAGNTPGPGVSPNGQLPGLAVALFIAAVVSLASFASFRSRL
jgi:hypothetical protein